MIKKFTLKPSFIAAATKEEIKQMADSLKDSIQGKGRMVVIQNDQVALCCLARFQNVIAGTQISKMLEAKMPDQLTDITPWKLECGKLPQDISVAESTWKDTGDYISSHNFDDLNDEYLTHEQIRTLLTKGEVTIQVEE